MNRSYEAINEVLVSLFNEIMDIEQKALIVDAFQNISLNDMHVIEAIGVKEPRNMSAVARSLSVTVGTLTIAVNHLVKKGYVNRERSEEDRRVVLLSLSEKGVKAYEHHAGFHRQMVDAVMEKLEPGELKVLVKVLEDLKGFFQSVQS